MSSCESQLVLYGTVGVRKQRTEVLRLGTSLLVDWWLLRRENSSERSSLWGAHLDQKSKKPLFPVQSVIGGPGRIGDPCLYHVELNF